MPESGSPASGERPLLEGMRIDALEYGGRGCGRAGGRVISVAGTAPGDVVVCRAGPEQRGRVEAELVTVSTPGPARRSVPCPYWEACGGCQLMQLEYPAQLEAKRGFVADAVHKATGLECQPDAVNASPREVGYRRRTTVRGAFGSGGIRLGLLRQGTRQIVDLPHCLILEPALSRALASVRALIGEHLDGSSGEFKLEAVAGSDGRVGLVFFIDRPQYHPFLEVCDALVAAGIAAIRIVDERGTILLEEGDPRQFVFRSMPSDAGPVEGRFSLQSFTQLNFEQNDALVEHVEAVAREIGAARILDLYAGIGNYSLTLARLATEVVSVESSMSAVADARDNAARLGLTNVRCLRGSSGQAVRELIRRGHRFDLVVLNPTRAGADGVVGHLAKLAPRRICYVSCSPPTLGRDLSVLIRGGFALTSLTPFDMFPQTYHVETVAVLDRGCSRAPQTNQNAAAMSARSKHSSSR